MPHPPDDHRESAIAINFAHATNLALVSTDSGGLVEFVNASALRLFGYTRAEMLGHPIDMIIPPRLRGAHSAGLKRIAAGNEARLKGRTVEVSALRKDGSEFPIEITLSVWNDDQGLAAGAIIKDISERKANDARLLRLANSDTLTGLPNRHRFTSLVSDQFQAGNPMTVILIALEGLKSINDAHGHRAGDTLLQAIGVRLPYHVSDGVTVARFGGDEFAILLTGVADGEKANAEADMILDAIRRPFDIGGLAFQLDATAGYAFGPAHGRDADELLASADYALYNATQAGRKTALCFDIGMRRETIERRGLQDELLNALRKREFVLHYQPQVDLTDGRVTGVEALIRWNHPGRGLLQPAQFLSALESSALAEDAGWWVLDEACRQLARWRNERRPAVKMSVNLFSSQLHSPNLTRHVADAISSNQLDPADLELEVTETIALNNDDRSFEILSHLRELGVGIAFDDFGTGYASLMSLQRYPLTTLKIDKSFTAGILTDARAASIVGALLKMSAELGLTTIAEGIETGQQMQQLFTLGCSAGQGYFYGRPEPAGTVGALLDAVMPAGRAHPR